MVDPSKTTAVAEWQVPKSVKEVQQFLGLCNYYRRFIRDFSTIALPLSSLTRKSVDFVWGQQQQQAFEQLKVLLQAPPVLRVFDPDLKVRIQSDASDFVVGGVIEQLYDDWHPVEYLSAKLSSAEQNYSATNREFLAIVTAQVATLFNGA